MHTPSTPSMPDSPKAGSLVLTDISSQRYYYIYGMGGTLTS
jgi:hypothetical protein